MSGSDLLVGVVAGVVATIIWALGAWIYRERRLRREFHPLTGTYRSTRKLTDQSEPETVSIRVSRNILLVEFEGIPDGDSVTGEIAMNEQLPRSGRGQYFHVKDGAQLWGFWDIQVKDANTILVHRTYANPKNHTAVVSGFVWSRIPR